MVRSHLSIDGGTKVAYQILRDAKVPNTVQVPLLEITTKDLNARMNAPPATGVATPPRGTTELGNIVVVNLGAQIGLTQPGQGP